MADEIETPVYEPGEKGAIRAAAAGLRRQLDARALEALMAGNDWAEGPVSNTSPDPFAIMNLFEPIKVGVEVKAGPIPPGSDAPAGFRVIRNADWLAAGKPGLAGYEAGLGWVTHLPEGEA